MRASQVRFLFIIVVVVVVFYYSIILFYFTHIYRFLPQINKQAAAEKQAPAPAAAASSAGDDFKSKAIFDGLTAQVGERYDFIIF